DAKLLGEQAGEIGCAARHGLHGLAARERCREDEDHCDVYAAIHVAPPVRVICVADLRTPAIATYSKATRSACVERNADDARRDGKSRAGVPAQSERRNAINASRSVFGMLRNVCCDASASPPCHRMASVMLRARPSCSSVLLPFTAYDRPSPH